MCESVEIMYEDGTTATDIRMAEVLRGPTLKLLVIALHGSLRPTHPSSDSHPSASAATASPRAEADALPGATEDRLEAGTGAAGRAPHP